MELAEPGGLSRWASSPGPRLRVSTCPARRLCPLAPAMRYFRRGERVAAASLCLYPGVPPALAFLPCTWPPSALCGLHPHFSLAASPAPSMLFLLDEDCPARPGGTGRGAFGAWDSLHPCEALMAPSLREATAPPLSPRSTQACSAGLGQDP